VSPTVEQAFVEPAYGSRSLVDVVPAVGAAIGVKHRPDEPVLGGLVLPEAPAYVVFLVDGLGVRLLERYAEAAPYLASLIGGQAPGTAGWHPVADIDQPWTATVIVDTRRT